MRETVAQQYANALKDEDERLLLFWVFNNFLDPSKY
jgi:hypothetical protein